MAINCLIRIITLTKTISINKYMYLSKQGILYFSFCWIFYSRDFTTISGIISPNSPIIQLMKINPRVVEWFSKEGEQLRLLTNYIDSITLLFLRESYIYSYSYLHYINLYASCPQILSSHLHTTFRLEICFFDIKLKML